MLDNDEQQMFTRRASFTEKSKERLEMYRRQSLQQNSDDGKETNKNTHTHTNLFSLYIRYLTLSMKVKMLDKFREERDNHFLSIQIRYNILFLN